MIVRFMRGWRGEKDVEGGRRGREWGRGWDGGEVEGGWRRMGEEEDG